MWCGRYISRSSSDDVITGSCLRLVFFRRLCQGLALVSPASVGNGTKSGSCGSGLFQCDWCGYHWTHHPEGIHQGSVVVGRRLLEGYQFLTV